MTPPKIAPNQSPPPPPSPEKASEPLIVIEVSKAEEIPHFQLAYNPLGRDLFRPHPMTPPAFDPTRYGLPADWKGREVDTGLDKRIFNAGGKGRGEDARWKMPDSFYAEQPVWLSDLIRLLNQVRVADLDMYNLSVNQGTNLRRFSEYAPKKKPLRPPKLDVQADTTAYVRGEIRPVQGQPDSLITRWVIRYDKPLLHESGLRIMGFSAADAPNIEYDTKFSDWQAVKDISGGDLDYENPQHTGAPMKTPWNYVAPPLPEGHRDWMIAFNPVVDTMVAGIKASAAFGNLDVVGEIPFLGFFSKGPIDEGRGKLYLWAFNPTVGMTPQFSGTTCRELREHKMPEKNLPVHCKIRPNTMPRKPGDLLDFFSPLFHPYRGGLLKHVAPYYNPNSEYIAPFVERGEKLLQWAKKDLGRDHSRPQEACKDLKGRWIKDRCLIPLPESYGDIVIINEDREKECLELKSAGKEDQCQRPIGRQQIPSDDSQVDRIIRELRSLGLPDIGRRRGSIIDWVSTDLMSDIDRLRSMKSKPYTVAHLELKPGRLPLSFGVLKIDDKTDIKVEYFAKPVQVPDLDKPGHTKWEAQVGLRFSLTSLNLTEADLSAMGFNIKADALKAKELQVEIPNILGMNQTQPQTRLPITAKIIGAEARGLHITDVHGDVDVAMDHATLKEASFEFEHPALLFGNEMEKKEDRLDRMSKNEGLDCSQKDNPCREPVWHASFKGLQGTGLQVGVPQIQGLHVAQFTIPTIEVLQRLKTKEGETRSDVLTLDIPALESKGWMDLDLKGKQEMTAKGNVLHLEGDSVLKNVRLTSQFKGDHSLLQGSFDLSGTIDKATLNKDGFGEISFTTKTNGHPIKPLSGHLELEIHNPAKLPYQTERPKGPPPKFNLDLDLPYVGLESKGALTIAPGSATIRNGKVHLEGQTKITGTVEGKLNLENASYEHQKKEPIEMGRMDVFPALKDFHARGYFIFEMLENGFRLSNPFRNPEDKAERYNENDPEHPALSVGFNLGGTKLHHHPDFFKGPLEAIAKGPRFETNFDLDQGQIEAQDLIEFEMQNLSVGGETKLRVTQLKSGPLFLSKIEGSGNIFLNILPFGIIELLFPKLGGAMSGKNPDMPDARALTAHLPEERKRKLREDLAGGDYLYAGGVLLTRGENGWATTARDVIFNLHENGGLNQYAMLRIPQVTFGMIGDEFKPPRLRNHLLNALINFPSHGGLTKLGSQDLWNRALRGEKK